MAKLKFSEKNGGVCILCRTTGSEMLNEAEYRYFIDNRIKGWLVPFSEGAGKLEYTYVISSLPLAGYPDVDSSLMAINSDVNDNITQYASIDLSAGTEANGYTPEAIPEPTTGLLVLLGVAGLALRRRRA